MTTFSRSEPTGVPLGVQREEIFVEAGHPPLVLTDQLRLERAVAVAGGGEGQLAQIPLHLLGATTVAAIRRAFAAARRRLGQINLGSARCDRSSPDYGPQHAYP